MALMVETMGTTLDPRHCQRPLPWTLDLTCPIALPFKPLSGTASPYPIAGPSRIPDEEFDDFVKRRYYETIYLSELFSPLSGLAVDILRGTESTTGGTNAAGVNLKLAKSVKPLLLSLPEIEIRHRKVLFPLLSAPAKEEPLAEIPLGEKELGAISLAAELRLTSRQAVEEGIAPNPKKISDEWEKREILIQIILLFIYITVSPPPSPVEKSKKRKRDQRDDVAPKIAAPADDPKNALDLLMDRLSVWQAVADLGLGVGSSDVKGTEKDENPIASMLGRFWKDVIVQFFLSIQPELCATLHLKIFGHPIPPKLLPVPPTTTKKPRKPKLTRARPSSDAQIQGLLAPPTISSDARERDRDSHRSTGPFARTSSSRAPSRAPSDAGSRASPPREVVSMRRSLSRTSDTQSRSNSFSQSQSQSQSQFRRSRSRSIDPSISTRPDSHPHPTAGSGSGSGSGGYISKKTMMRAQSGKDLFKGREVGLMRRTTSRKVEGLGREDSQRFGLLGRKTSGGKESQSQSQSQQRSSMEESQRPSTLIMATPSKPRHQFGRSNTTSANGYSQQWFPTPIQEEPRSVVRPRPTFIAETPVHARMMNPKTTSFDDMAMDSDSGEESDDPLADLMVMTDDEVDDKGQITAGRGRDRDMIPETPVR